VHKASLLVQLVQGLDELKEEEAV